VAHFAKVVKNLQKIWAATLEVHSVLSLVEPFDLRNRPRGRPSASAGTGLTERHGPSYRSQWRENCREGSGIETPLELVDARQVDGAKPKPLILLD
jgi:hypothetical protein